MSTCLIQATNDMDTYGLSHTCLNNEPIVGEGSSPLE